MKSITRGVLFVRISKNEKCKICLLMIFQPLTRGHFQNTKKFFFYLWYFENGLRKDVEVSVINEFYTLCFYLYLQITLLVILFIIKLLPPLKLFKV